MHDTFLKLEQLSSELWNEKKGLDYANRKQVQQHFIKIEKLIKEIKELDFNAELEFLKEVYLKKIYKDK
ncbi:hypothetical protein KJ781_05455 [Patescibacteria group bacterium]|nr:hypothetical protein [Patescibacteria group bacterium]MBU1449265.1 hypothetical protein [Patescibacteria group bacterium]